MESKEGYVPKKEMDLGDFAGNEPDYSELLKSLEPDVGPKPENVESRKETLTPETVKQIWDGLSRIEKNLVVSSNHVFESVIERYENLKGGKKAKVLRGLRKLILSKSPLVSLIEIPEGPSSKLGADR